MESPCFHAQQFLSQPAAWPAHFSADATIFSIKQETKPRKDARERVFQLTATSAGAAAAELLAKERPLRNLEDQEPRRSV